MNEILSQFLESILEKKTSIQTWDEATAKQGLILKLLHILGWDTFNTDKVIPEYSVEKRRVDYALAVEKRPEIFIEVKRPSQDLENHQNQLLEYSFREGIELAILTNGLLYWFYLPTEKGSWTKRRFYTIDILSQDAHEIAKKFIDLLEYKNVCSGQSIKESRRIHASRLKKSVIEDTIPEAWTRIITEPDSLLIDLMVETIERIGGYRPDNKAVEQFFKKHQDLFTQIQTQHVHVPDKTQPTPSTKTTYLGSAKSKSGDSIQVSLNKIHTPRTYSLIPFPKEARLFFPGYKVPFIIETDAGNIETHVTSAPKGTVLGDPQAGTYVQGGLKIWYDHHLELSDGAILKITCIDPGRRYRLLIIKPG